MEREFELINQYQGLIYKIAKKFYNVELNDLYQAGCIGLIKASRKFNKEQNNNFMSFAYISIFGEMYELANKSRDIKLNKSYLRMYKEIQRASSELLQLYNRYPTPLEIGEYLNIDESLISEVITVTTQMVSLDDEYRTINGDNLEIKECIGSSDNVDDRILINDSIEQLEPLEQSVINCRYFQDLTQMETADILGISQVKVSRVEEKGKKKIKEYIAA